MISEASNGRTALVMEKLYLDYEKVQEAERKQELGGCSPYRYGILYSEYKDKWEGSC